jgi:hypothetical protein
MIEQDANVPAPRIPLKIQVDFRRSYSRGSEKGLLRNISMTGAFLQHERIQLQPHDKLAITFNVAGRVRKIAAQVIWSNDRGCGIKFLPINNQDTQIVDDLIGVVQETRASKRMLLDDIFKRVA